jgi:hypothetical protein
MGHRLGIDLGNVLTERRGEGFKPFADDAYRFVRPSDGAFQAVKSLVDILDENNVFIVSRCSIQAQDRARDWLDVWEFHDITGVPRDNVRFCLERPQKKLIAKELQLTHFIDDRWSVLIHLLDLHHIEKLYLFQPFPDEQSSFSREELNRVQMVEEWTQIVSDLC